MKFDPKEYVYDVVHKGTEPVIDSVTFKAAEIDTLTQVIAPRSLAGRATLLEDLLYGVGGLRQVLGQQEAAQELSEGGEYTERVEEAAKMFSEHEVDLYRLINRDYAPINGSDIYKSSQKASRALSSLAVFGASDSKDAPASPVLRQLNNTLLDYNLSEGARLLEHQLYFTPLGMRGRPDAKFLPRLKFRPGMFTGRLLAANAIAIGSIRSGIASQEAAQAWAPYISMFPVISTVSPMMKPVLINDIGFHKIFRKFKNNPQWNETLLAIGKLDELLSLANFKKSIAQNGYATVWPQIEQAETYRFSAQGLRNPLLTSRDSIHEVVPNDLELGTNEDSRLKFLTGPNSGGKSTYSKAAVLNQLSGQIGGPVAALMARITIADKVAYHVPMPPNLEEQTGRFGFELKQVKKYSEQCYRTVTDSTR